MSVSDLRRWRWIVVLASASVFIASLIQPAFVVDVTVVQGRVDPFDAFGLELLLFGWSGWFEGPELFGFGGVAFGQNLLVWPSVVASWVFACKKWRIAAAIAGLCAIGLVSVSPVLGPFGRTAGSLGYAAWLANPIIATAWILYLADRQPSALISAMASLGLALSFLIVQEGPFGLKLNDIVPIISYGIGYWLWVASAAILASCACADVFLFRSVPTAGRRCAGKAAHAHE